MSHSMPDEAQIRALVGHRFPGGHYRVAHWESTLLTDCTGADPLPAGQVHPIALFHMPIAGAGTSIAELFALGQAESDLSILIESYDWEFEGPLYEEREYRIEGQIISADRRQSEAGQFFDRIAFRFDVSEPEGAVVARSTITWHFTRNTL